MAESRASLSGASRILLQETYSDFEATADGLTVPRTWKIRLTIKPATGPARAFEWSTIFAGITNNGPLEPALCI